MNKKLTSWLLSVIVMFCMFLSYVHNGKSWSGGCTLGLLILVADVIYCFKSKINKLIIKWFKIVPCKKCGSWETQRGYFVSGWNNFCRQASGDDGRVCNECLHVEFDKSFEERKVTKPDWVELYR